MPLKLVGFSAETGDVESLLVFAKEKLKNKNVDLIVGNLAQESFGSESTRVWLLDRSGAQEEVAVADKNSVASSILKAVLENA